MDSQVKGPQQYHSRSIRLNSYDYSQPGAYFLTICAHKHASLFGEIVDGEMVKSQFGHIVQTFWQELPRKFRQAETDLFAVMPNHVHGIINIETAAIRELPLQVSERRQMLVPQMVGWFKMNTAKAINQTRGTPGVPVWQRNYWEHVVRNELSLQRIREYITNNPVTWSRDAENPEATGHDDIYDRLSVSIRSSREADD